MNFGPPTLLEECQALLRNINRITGAQENTVHTLADFRDIFSRALTPHEDATRGGSSRKWLTEAMAKLAAHADNALNHDPEYFANLIQVLAAGTRHSTNWRHYFGVLEPDHEITRDTDPGCILEVARRVITLNYAVSSRTIENALKIIANICADSNENRGLIIQRGGMYSLLQLSQHKVTLNILIPALFNVCVSDDESATVSDPNSRSVNEEHLLPPGGSLDDAQEVPSIAVEQLATAYSSSQDFTTFELLLSFGQGSIVGSIVKPFLADLVEMSVQPALGGFEKIRSLDREPWQWTCSINGIKHDTVAMAIQFARRGEDTLTSVSRAVLSLLSLQEARDALLRRDDAALWLLINLPNFGCSIEDETFEANPDLNEIRTAFLKILYEITGDLSFSCIGSRTPALIHQCVDQLEKYVLYLGSERISSEPAISDGSQLHLSASACVIISQLAATEEVRNELLANEKLHSAIASILELDKSPDVLYPAVTIISRLALSHQQDLPFIKTGVLSKMQRLLTSQGLGLIVPFETVTAYKTIIRGRPAIISTLLTAKEQGTSSVITNLFTLWTQTIEAGTKLEIAKFFLELLRTTIHASPPDKTTSPPSYLTYFLSTSSSQLAEIFAWVSLKAEPISQRQHGWFCLAMLSTWAESRAAILRVLDQQSEVRAAVLGVSELEDGAVHGNVMLMLSRLQGLQLGGVSLETREVLGVVARRLGIGMSDGG